MSPDALPVIALAFVVAVALLAQLHWDPQPRPDPTPDRSRGLADPDTY